MSEQQLHLARGISATILEGFDRHFSIYQQITSGAKKRFEESDWRAAQRASRERIVLYDHRVEETIALVRELYGVHDIDTELWKQIKLCYMRQLSYHQQPELAETFYNSVFCRRFDLPYYTNEFIFLRNAISTDYIESSQDEETSYRCYYPNTQGLRAALYQLIEDQAFTLPFEDLERDINASIRRIVSKFKGKDKRKTNLNFQLRVICRPFFRNKAAYIVGNYMNGRDVKGFAFAIINNERGQLFIDALLIGEKELSVVFSYSQAYFMIEHQVPSSIIAFLQLILPERNRSELYSAIGFHKQGKSDFYRHFLHHLRHSNDKFIVAPGIRGMVMAVFTLPSYRYVFKIIKDKFAPQKNFTRKQVEEKYQLVKRHDRVGRMADMLEYSNVALPVDRFRPELLEEIKKTCASSIFFEKDNIVFKHIYLERRMTPLNMFMEKATNEELEHVIKDYGNAIKQLAAANIFPGDFLYKNFGLTQLGRVVFYDYDEITYMTECNFRKIPAPRYPEDIFSSEPWYSVGPHDVFPEEFATFLLTNPKVRKIFMKYHKDLLDAEYWKAKQQNILNGIYEDVFPYPQRLRFK
uniref:Isocitrate dehydrogenase kinase/phosphatase n=1 Tax=uncultured Thiotrichaceae bacterium TaxID=298394 RepID=A0A6S6UEG4_9GAMM|nr:MAG: Isocitrate dehydrogenase phosphatase (EC /kinase (EC [uncultured Thiotrichaceae bacterium]